MGKHQDDLRYLHNKLRGFEEELAALRTVMKSHNADATLAETERKLLDEIDNIEYVLKRDRVNRGKPS